MFAARGGGFTEDEEKLVDKGLDLHSFEAIALSQVLMDNTDLAVHPFLDRDFVAKGCRECPYPTSDAEFKKLYKEYQDRAPKDQKSRWVYPPDFERMETVEYCTELGLDPEGVWVFTAPDLGSRASFHPRVRFRLRVSWERQSFFEV